MVFYIYYVRKLRRELFVHSVISTFADSGTWIWSVALGLASVWAIIHAILNKRESRAASLWVVLILAVPLIGIIFYFLFGINRIQRKARRLGIEHPVYASVEHTPELGTTDAEPLPFRAYGDVLVGWPVVQDNAVAVFSRGEDAYTRMVEAIRAAKRTVYLESYIFKADRAGQAFIEACGEARARGAKVCVLVDAVGGVYAFPKNVVRLLRDKGVSAAAFLPTFRPWSVQFMNLRLHRKLLVIDGEVAFTGGMNIQAEHAWLKEINDVHFEFRGPVVNQLEAVFAADWSFAADEDLEPSRACPAGKGLPFKAAARAVSDGPDDDIGQIRRITEGAVSESHRHVRVVSPYFVPDGGLKDTLVTALLRGVKVEVLIPEKTDLPWVTWAGQAQLWELLKYGAKIYRTPAPFDHSKLMVVDGLWSFIGSANWDSRSFRLNFELNVECWDAGLAKRILAISDERMKGARQVTYADFERRSFMVRLRDGFARLFSPVL